MIMQFMNTDIVSVPLSNSLTENHPIFFHKLVSNDHVIRFAVLMSKLVSGVYFQIPLWHI